MTDGTLRIAAVTAHRPHEIVEPLTLADGTVEVLDIDPSDSFVERNLKTIHRLVELTGDPKPDIVLSDCLGLLGFLVAAVCVVRGVPFVFRFKGNHWLGLTDLYRTEKADDGLATALRYYLTYALDEAIYAAACGYVVVSEELKDVVVERTGCRPELVHVVHVPLVPDREDGSAAAARERFGIDAETVFLTVTNLKYEGKYDGVRTIVRGMESVLETHEDVAYVVAGGGPFLDDVRRLAADAPASVRDRIHAVGFVDDVADLYALADGFVYVSHIDGYPRAVLEAQQSALPVVVNAAHGMVEQVQHGETGFVLEEATPEAVAEHVTRLLDGDDGARLGENGRARARTENDPAVVGERLVAALTDIASRRDR